MSSHRFTWAIAWVGFLLWAGQCGVAGETHGSFDPAPSVCVIPVQSSPATVPDTEPMTRSKDCAAPGSIAVVEAMAHEIIIRVTFAEFGGGARMELDGQTLTEGLASGGSQLMLFRELEERTDYRICVWNFCDEGMSERSQETCQTVGTIEQGTCDPPSSWRVTEVTETSFTFDLDVGPYPGVMIAWKNDGLNKIRQLPAGPYATTLTGDDGDVFDLWFWEFCNAGKTEISPRRTERVIIGQTQPSSCCDEFTQIERWIPHVPSATGIYRGTLLFYSTSNQERDVTLCAFDAAGTLLGEAALSFAPWVTERQPTSDLFSSPEVAFIGICGSSSIAASIIYENISDPTPCVVSEDVGCGRVLRFTSGGTNNWDGFAALNLSETSSANLEITQLSPSGSIITSLDMTVTPTSKLVVNLYSQGFSPVDQAFFEIRTNTPVCVLALRGLNDRSCGDALFSNPVQVIE